MAEDDFTTPEGISQCIQFLESHPDYTSAQGHYLTFESNRNNVKFTPRYIRNLNSQITGETARERLLSKGSLYGSLLYAVVRTEAFKKTYEVCFDPADKILFNNLFLLKPCLIIPCFYTRKICHNSRIFIFELDKLPSLSIKQKITNYFLLKNNPISRFINYRYLKKGEKTCKGIDSIPIATVSIKNKEQIPAPLRPICDAIRLTKKQFSWQQP